MIADIADDKEREQAFLEAVKLLGGTLDIIVNGAGVQRRHKSEEFPMKDWKFVLDVNLTAVFSLWHRSQKHSVMSGPRRESMSMHWRRVIWLRR